MTDDLERELETRLAEHAPPAPPHILGAVMTRIERVPQVAVPGSRSPWLGRAAIVAAAASVVLVAVLWGPDLLHRLAPGIGTGSVGGGPTPAMAWDARLQFRGSPDQVNPAPDGYGNQAVFSYLTNLGAVNDPTRYRLLGDFNAGADRWYDASLPGLYLGASPLDRLEAHPTGGGSGSHAAILGWRSPVDASVVVTGSVEVDASCGDGILFSIDQGSSTIEQLALPTGLRQFAVDVDVDIGQALYFIVEPGADDACDTTWLTVAVRTR
jgi:hypothetical protein